MNIEKIEQMIKVMKSNGVSYMKFKDEQVEIELDLKSNTTSNETTTKTTEANDDNKNTTQTIDAEIIGTFYLQDEEELSNPLVKVGDEVKKGQVVGYIESMKVLNEVTSDYDGTVAEIHIDHAEPVEYGQTIITLK